MAHGPLVKLLLRVWGHGSLDNCVKADRRVAGEQQLERLRRGSIQGAMIKCNSWQNLEHKLRVITVQLCGGH